jgi:2-hydroxy-3-keto-5-methylthiopentenyl-1-phosphate phosphatase
VTTGKLLRFSPYSFNIGPLTQLRSIHGHDKSIEIRKYSSLPNRPTLFYAGDGVSDLSAAKETDLLFAKAGKGK